MLLSNLNENTAIHGATGSDQKSFKPTWLCHQLLSRFLSKDHLPQVSSMSANDEGDNEKILRAVLRSPGIYLTGEENSGKPQLGDRR